MDTLEPDIVIYAWCPKGVQRVISSGGNNYVGIVDENTVLKYPQIPAEQTPNVVGNEKLCSAVRKEALRGLQVEEQIFRVLGSHDRIVEFKGMNDFGLLLELMPNGSVADYLHNCESLPPLTQRLKWAMQTAEAVAYIHDMNVLHCDISVGNILLDKDENIKLCDFQGKLLSADGTVLLDGGSAEGVRSSMPRPDPSIANQKTDLFALGTTMYFIMTGGMPFPELDSWKDASEIERRFAASLFPSLDEAEGGAVLQKCWTGQYESAKDVVQELGKLWRKTPL